MQPRAFTIVYVFMRLRWSLLLLCLGLSWFLASLGVFVRDINYTVALMIQVLFFLTPIFYAVENIPEPYRTIIGFNPLTPIVENVRRVVLWGLPPLWVELLIWIVVTGALMVCSRPRIGPSRTSSASGRSTTSNSCSVSMRAKGSPGIS